LVFVVVAFSSTAGYDSGNEAQLALRRLCYSIGRSVPRSATRFYPGAREKFFNPSLASLSASAWGVNSNRVNPPAVALKRRVTAPLASPLAGYDPARCVTGKRIIHADKNVSSPTSIKAFAARLAVENFSTVWKSFDAIRV
jgi:hypothetical protein